MESDTFELNTGNTPKYSSYNLAAIGADAGVSLAIPMSGSVEVSSDIKPISNIPDLKKSLTLIGDKVDVIEQLNNLDKLVVDNKVDKSTASLILERYQDLKKEAPLGLFTSTKSNHGFNQLKTAIKNKIAVEHQILINHFKTLLDEPISLLVSLFNHLQTESIPALDTLINQTKEVWSKEAPYIFDTAASRFNEKDTAWEAFLSKDIRTITIEEAVTRLKSVSMLKEAISNFKDILNSTSLFNFYLILTGNTESQALCIKTIMNFILDPSLPGRISSLISQNKGQMEELVKIKEIGLQIADNPEKIMELINNNGSLLSRVSYDFTRVSDLVYQLSLLAVSVRQIASAYSQRK